MLEKLFPKRRHEAQFGNTELHFTFLFDSRGKFDNYRLAQRLLAAEVAETAIRASDGEVAVSPRFRDLLRGRRQAERLKNAASGSLWHVFVALIRSPRLTTALLRSIASSFNRRTESVQTVGKIGQPEEPDPANDSATRAIDFIDESVLSLRMESAVYHATDKTFFSPEYLQSDPYIRLQLRGFEYELALPSRIQPDAPVEKMMVTPDLVLHASGVALLTFAIHLPPMRTRELMGRTRADWIGFNRTLMPEAILAPYATSQGVSIDSLVGVWDLEIKAGTRWRDSRFKEPVTLSDVFNIYQAAIVESGKLPETGGNWICYPKVFIEGLHCCGSRKAWLSAHLLELVGIIARAPWYESMDAEYARKQLESDLVDSTDASMYANMGSTTKVQWSFHDDSRNPVNNLIDSTVLSHALMQFGQLRLLERLSVARDQNGNAAKMAEELLAYGLQEVSSQNLSSGTARNMATHLADHLGVPQMYARVRERLDVIRQINSLNHDKTAARRANKIAAVALLVASIVALPNLNEGLQAISQIEIDKNNRFLSSVHEFAAGGPPAAVALFLLLMATVLVIVAPRPRRTKGPRRSVKLGMHWPDQEINVIMEQERPDGPQKRNSDDGNGQR